MRLIKSIAIALAAIAPASVWTVRAMAAVNTVYTLDLTRGRFPEGVTAENANGVIPDVAGYSRGYTKSGWMTDRYGSRGYVALAPTYTGLADTPCESILSLPPMTVGEDEWLSWEGVSVYRQFPESYRVEALATGSDIPVTLYETASESGEWQRHVVSLARLAGQEVTLRFVATSTCGYMLALTEVKVIAGFDSYLQVDDSTRRMQGYLDGSPSVRVDMTNLGSTVEDMPMQCIFKVSDIPEEDGVTLDFRAAGEWKGGETRSFSIEVPEEMWGNCVSYTVVRAPEAPERVAGGLAEGAVTVGPFSRRLMVDKATGMWCVNCPAGDVALDALRATYGEDVIAVNTHINDALDNPDYWSELQWYSVPRMMLNRIRASEGEVTGNFGAYLDATTDFGLRLKNVVLTSDGRIEAEATVSVAEPTDNSSGRYRIGYVVTADFYDPSNPAYLQQNTCNSLKYGVYYMLPSKIIPALMHYEDVSLTSAGAFGGIEGSLPDELMPGEEYGFRWQTDIPELLSDPTTARVVAFLLDAETGEALNADRLGVGETPWSGLTVAADNVAMPSVRPCGNGDIMILGASGKRCIAEVFSAEGRALRNLSKECGADAERVALGLERGLYVVRLSVEGNSISVKMIIR